MNLSKTFFTCPQKPFTCQLLAEEKICCSRRCCLSKNPTLQSNKDKTLAGEAVDVEELKPKDSYMKLSEVLHVACLQNDVICS